MKTALALVLLMFVSACGSLLPKPPPAPSFYALTGTAAGGSATAAAATTAASATVNRPTLVVNPPQAAAGYDSARIIYIRQPHQLQYFAQSEWVDTPARMLAPLLVAALSGSGTFKAVVTSPSAAAAELRLDTEIVRLQQDFDAAGGSAVQFTLRATVVDNVTRKVRGTREFDARVTAGSDAYSGVLAANDAVKNLLAQLTSFCVAAAAATSN